MLALGQRVRRPQGLEGTHVMYDMMNGGTMWGMGLWWLLVIVLVLLGVAALFKYLFFSHRG
jgi:hypothetical protein